MSKIMQMTLKSSVCKIFLAQFSWKKQHIKLHAHLISCFKHHRKGVTAWRYHLPTKMSKEKEQLQCGAKKGRTTDIKDINGIAKKNWLQKFVCKHSSIAFARKIPSKKPIRSLKHFKNERKLKSIGCLKKNRIS